MRVKYLELSNFMLFDSATVELPMKGIVLVTGANGEGKSSIIESVAVAGWNKTLRGSPWYRDGAVSSVEMETDEVTVVRQRLKSGKVKCKFTEEDFDTPGKGQPSLEALIGTFEVWRKTSVFSSASVEGAHFSASSDGERKKLLETILGLGQFDPAYKQCTRELRAATANLERAQLKYDKEDALVDACSVRAKDAAKALKALPKVSARPPQEEARELGKEISKLTPERDALWEDKKETQRMGHDAYALVKNLKNKARMLQQNRCPVCSQKIPKALIDQLTAKLEEAKQAQKKTEHKQAKELELLEDEIADIEYSINEMIMKQRKLHQESDAYEETKRNRKHFEDAVRSSSLNTTKAMTARAEHAASLKTYGAEAALLQQASRVLGLRGVRAHILKHSLQGLSQVSNQWLEMMDTDISISLDPYKTNKDKTVADAISINIDGAGGGFGYKACSTGQRRRIDVGIILGLAEMASAAHGMSTSTLFFDEVFDVLDRDGTRGVAKALEHLAESRAVVVISHSSELQKHLDADVHLHVEAGNILCHR